MKKISFPKHKLEWSVSAGEAVKKAREERAVKIRAKEIKKIVSEEFGKRLKDAWVEIKGGWFNPLRLILWAPKATFATIGFVTVTWSKIYKSRKTSKAKKEAAMRNLAAVLVAEMVNDSEYRKGIKKLVEDRKLCWLSVNRAGAVMIGKNRTSGSINLAELIKSAPKSKAQSKSSKGNIFPTGIVYVNSHGANFEVYSPTDKKVTRIVAKDIKSTSLRNHPPDPDKKKLVIVTNAGGQSFLLKKEDALRIYEAIKKR